MTNKYLDVFISNTGKKIKTSGMTLNQNSSNNQVRAMLEGNYDLVEVWFRQPNGKISPKYHMIYKGKYEPDVVDDVLQNYNEFNEWIFDIPLGITSFTMPNPSARLEISFAFYQYNNSGNLIVASVANSQIVVNRSNNNNVLDQNYNGVDVQNLWRSVGNLTQRIDMFNDMEFSTVAKENALPLKNIHIDGDDWNPLLPTEKQLSSSSTDETVPTSKATYTGAKKIAERLAHKLHFDDVPNETIKDTIDVKKIPSPSKTVISVSYDEEDATQGAELFEQDNWPETYKYSQTGIIDRIQIPYILYSDETVKDKKIVELRYANIDGSGGPADVKIQLYKIPKHPEDMWGEAPAWNIDQPFIDGTYELVQEWTMPKGSNKIRLKLDKPIYVTDEVGYGFYFRGAGYPLTVYTIEGKEYDRMRVMNIYSHKKYVNVMPLTVIGYTKRVDTPVEIDDFPEEANIHSKEVTLKRKIIKETVPNPVDNLSDQLDKINWDNPRWENGPFRFKGDKPYIDMAKTGPVNSVTWIRNTVATQQGKEGLVYMIPLEEKVLNGGKGLNGTPEISKYPIVGRTKGIGKVTVQLTQPVDTSKYALWLSDLNSINLGGVGPNEDLQVHNPGGTEAIISEFPMKVTSEIEREIIDPDQEVQFSSSILYKPKHKLEFYMGFEYSSYSDSPLEFEIKAYNKKENTIRYGKLSLTSDDYTYTLNGQKKYRDGITFEISNLFNHDIINIRQLESVTYIDGNKFTISASPWTTINILVEDPNLYDPTDPFADINDVLMKINVQEKIKKLEDEGTGGGSGGGTGGNSFRIPLNISENYNITKLKSGSYELMNNGGLINAIGTRTEAFKGEFLSVDNYNEVAYLYGRNGALELGFTSDSFTPSNKQWKGLRWTCFGDSLTAKDFVCSKHYYDYIQEETGIQPIVAAYPGNGYKTFSKKAATEEVPVDVDVLTIFGSFNDAEARSTIIGTAYDIEDQGEEKNTLGYYMNKTLETLFKRNPSLRVGLIAPTPWAAHNMYVWTDTKSTQYVKLLHDVAKRWSIPFLNLYEESGLMPWRADNRDLYYTEEGGSKASGIHPDRNGHAVFAPKIKQFLEKVIRY